MSEAWRNKNIAYLLWFSVISVFQLMEIEEGIFGFLMFKKIMSFKKNMDVEDFLWLSLYSGFLQPQGKILFLSFKIFSFFKLNCSFYTLLIPFPYCVGSSSCNSSGSKGPFLSYVSLAEWGERRKIRLFSLG